MIVMGIQDGIYCPCPESRHRYDCNHHHAAWTNIISIRVDQLIVGNIKKQLVKVNIGQGHYGRTNS